MNIDWEKSPNGATHCAKVNESRLCWYIIIDAFNYKFAYQDLYVAPERWDTGRGKPDHGPLIERPQPKQWSGPQDGLPPVGTVCEFQRYDSAWVRCLIKLVDSDGIVIKCSGYLGSLFAKNCSLLTFAYGSVKFRAIKTEEQIATEQRETAIREFMDIVGIDCRVTASKAVDAGFKREACKSDCSTNNRGVPELLGPCDCR